MAGKRKPVVNQGVVNTTLIKQMIALTLGCAAISLCAGAVSIYAFDRVWHDWPFALSLMVAASCATTAHWLAQGLWDIRRGRVPSPDPRRHITRSAFLFVLIFVGLAVASSFVHATRGQSLIVTLAVLAYPVGGAAWIGYMVWSNGLAASTRVQ